MTMHRADLERPKDTKDPMFDPSFYPYRNDLIVAHYIGLNDLDPELEETFHKRTVGRRLLRYGKRTAVVAACAWCLYYAGSYIMDVAREALQTPNDIMMNSMSREHQARPMEYWQLER